MFITKHLLALVALAVGAASSCDVCSKKLIDGKCGGLSQEAKGKWGDWITPDGCISDVCCASNEDDCCEANVGANVGIVLFLVVVIGGSIFAYRKYRQHDETYGVAVPPGPLGVSFVDGTCTVHVVKPTSPLLGATKKGETLLSVNGKPVTPATIFDVIKAADDGTSERELVFRGSSKNGVAVPPGPLGVSFVDGTCTVHVVKPTSPLLGATKKGETLLSVNGKPVTPATIFDVIKAADDGTGERKLVFRTYGGTPAGMTAGGTWVEQVYAGPETKKWACFACLFFGLPGLCILMWPGDKRMVYVNLAKNAKPGPGRAALPDGTIVDYTKVGQIVTSYRRRLPRWNQVALPPQPTSDKFCTH